MEQHAVQNHEPQASAEHEQIIRALDAVHNPRSSNGLRREASLYLEKIREDARAPEQGFQIACNFDQQPIVRHYGLSLIDYAIRHKWTDYTREQSATLRNWVLDLARGTAGNDPSFITNKVAELWVEIAKRSWAIDWMDMDEMLFHLWEGNTPQKIIVLIILETLSDEVFTTEDSVAALRGSDLNRACVDIFIPASVLTEQFPSREKSVNLRYGSDGWLTRVSAWLDQFAIDKQSQGSNQGLAMKALSICRSTSSWILPKALVANSTVYKISACLAVPQKAVQMAAMDALYALYNRLRFSEGEFQDVVGPMFKPETTGLLIQLYQWLQVSPTDIDDGKYLMLKRLSETVFNLGRLLAEQPSNIPDGSDLAGFIDLLMRVMKNDSLQVSIPALHLWVKFMQSQVISKSPAVQAVMAELLETCSRRLLRYESLPADGDNASVLFLNEDIETMPERHAFLGNYARFCNQIVELVVQQQPIDALYHILGQADQVLIHLYDNEPPFSPSSYTRNSIPWLKIDAQFTVIEAALKGCLKWLTRANNGTVKHEHEVMISNLQVWCDRLLGLTFEDPLIKERVIQLAVGFATGPLKQDPQFAVRVFDYILEMNCPDFPQFSPYSDAVKDLQTFATQQLQRLALRFPDHLITIFEVLEQKIVAISKAVAFDEQTKARYTSVLFVILHRATGIDDQTRQARLTQFVDPLISRWQDDELSRAMSNSDTFSKLLGLDDIQQYLVSRQVQNISNWSSQPLDEDGRVLQSRMQAAVDALPLRATKHLMSASVEKLEKGTSAYENACRLWQAYSPLLLPSILQFIRLSHSLYDPSNWKNLPYEMSSVVRQIFTDRFWQVGISQGSRDEFYASIGGTKTSLEGFASSIRAAMRLIRETGYRLLFYLSLLGTQLYGQQDLPQPLADALFADACALSPHQMALLIDTMRPIIENCPGQCRNHFLPPILSAMFEQVDRKAHAEWQRIEQRKSAATEDDDLASEMKDESVLRQLTLSAVTLVVGLLEPERPILKVDTGSETNGIPLPQSNESTRDFVLQTPLVLKPLILFCTHALLMHDTRACSLIAKVLRTIIGDFSGDTPLDSDVREFISTEVLKACVTSLNDPYFVDMQKDFAQLIASILVTYSPRTETPKQVLLSLPDMTHEKVDRAVRHLLRANSNPKQQRAIILDFLKGFRGVGIHEQGKLPKTDPNKLRSHMQQRYMTAGMEGMDIREEEKEDGPDLGGVAEMFK